MAIIVPIVSKFDDKGLKSAQSEFGKLGKAMKGLIGAVGLSVGLSAIVSGLKESAVAASEDVKSQALLAQQLKNTVGATNSQVASVESSIKAMQNQAAVADDQIRPAFASLVRSTGDIGEATRLTTLALDVAAGTGKDLGAVSLALGKAINGSKTSLEKLIPSIKGAKDPMGELQKQFGGMAATAANADPFQRMQIIFQDIQEQIGMQLLPSLQELATWLASPVGQAEIAKLVDWFKQLAKAVGTGIIWLKDNYKWVLLVGGLAATVGLLATAFEAVTTAIKLATAAQWLLNIAQDANPIGAIILLVGALATAWTLAAGAVTGYANASADATDTGGASGSFTPTNSKGGPLTLNQANKQYGKAKPKTPVTPTDPLKDLQKKLDALNKVNDKNTTGETAAQKAARIAAEKAAKARKAIADAAKKAAEDARQAFTDLKTAADDFNKSFEKTASEFTAVFKMSSPMGEFEQKTVDAFDSIKQSAQDAFDSKLITAKALSDLNKYADQEAALLRGIAKQRDVLAKKISIAQSVTNGVMGSLNLTSMLQSETKQVTKSVTSMVNGIALTTTQTFDEVVSGGLADSFKKLVDKTKTFAANLIKLKDLGLNGNLFKQIVDAGAESGNATAEAIIAGGASAVTELNGLFKELTDAGSSIAETATPVMYDLGDEMTNSFIDGLRSEDQKLIDTATAMAALFTESFKSALGSAILPTLNASGVTAGLGMDNTDYIRGIGRVTSSGTTPTGQPITIHVNAGMIASKQEIPGMIVDALGTYTKQSGAGGLTRVLGL